MINEPRNAISLSRWRHRLPGPQIRLLLLAALLTALLVVIVGLSLRLEYRADANGIFDEANRSAQKLASRTTEVLDQVSQTTLLVKYLRETGSPVTLQSLQAGGVLAQDVTQALLVSDARGFVLEATSDKLALNVADDDHFKRLRVQPPGAVDLGAVQQQPALGVPSMPISRRISGVGGQFAGVVTALIPPGMLVAGHTGSEAASTAVTLIGLDGVIRARLLNGSITYGDRVNMQNLAARTQAARLQGLPVKSTIDGVERFIVVVEVARYPLVALVAVDAKAALSGYRRSRDRMLLWSAVMALLLVTGTAALLVQARRLGTSRQRQQEAEAGLRATLDGSLDSVVIMKAQRDAEGRLIDLVIVDANARAAEFVGGGETRLIGQRLCELMPTIRSGGYLTQFERVIRTRKRGMAEVQASEPHLAGRWLDHQLVAVGVDGVALITRDVSERRLAAQALAENRNFLQNLLDYLPLAVYAKSARPDTLGRYLFWNRAAESSFQLSAAEVVGNTVRELFEPAAAERFEHQDAALIAGGEPQRFAEQRFESPAGRRYFDTFKVPVRGADGQIDHVLVIAEDITERREHLARLEQQELALAELARRDSLTGLPNRRHFDERLAEALLRAERSAQMLALLFIDLDGFKTVNDELGHEAGDHVLMAVAARLKACVRTTDLVARLGGDEFTVILEAVEGEAALRGLCQRMVEALSVPHLLNGQSRLATPSMGLAVAQPGEAADSLMRRADDAMYAAKRAGKARFAVAA